MRNLTLGAIVLFVAVMTAAGGEAPDTNYRTRNETARDRENCLLAGIEGGPEVVLPWPRFLFHYNKGLGPRPVEHPYVDVLPAGTRVRPLSLEDGQLTVKTQEGATGWFAPESLAGLVSLCDIPNIVVTPSLYEDVTGDGVPDMLLWLEYELIDGRTLVSHSTANIDPIGIWRNRFVQVHVGSPTTLVYREFTGRKTGSVDLPVGPLSGRPCDPATSFYYARRESHCDSVVRVFGIDDSGVAWARSLRGNDDYRFNLYQADSCIFLWRAFDRYLLSASDGHTIWEQHNAARKVSRFGVFFCRAGVAIAQYGRLVLRDWHGGVVFDVRKPGNWSLPECPDLIVEGNWSPSVLPFNDAPGVFCHSVPVIDSRYIPLVVGDRVVLTPLSGQCDEVETPLWHIFDGFKSRGKDRSPNPEPVSREVSFPFSGSMRHLSYDRHGFYLGSDSAFRGYAWDGSPMRLVSVPEFQYPIWDGDTVAFYYGFDGLLNAEAAQQVASQMSTAPPRPPPWWQH